MKRIVQKTPLKKVEELQRRRKWYLVDAADQILGRLATRIVLLLRGKTKPDFSPHLDGGDYVIVLNAAKVKVTGKKAKSKKYYRHSGYPEGLKTESWEDLLKRRPELIIQKAVRGMLPKGRIGPGILKRLKVYALSEHPHKVKNLEILKLEIK